MTDTERVAAMSWSRNAVIYQIYPRSFADSDGDGVGDLPGITSRLDYLVDLGVDAIWLSPFYPSPMADGGYDVADYRDIDPQFGTLADAEALVAACHERGLRLIIDIVPNHVSSAHPWFVEAVAGGPGRDRFHFRYTEDLPNDWGSFFHGPAWTRLPDGSWYLHLFASEQPDLNWDHPEVRAEFAEILRFWLDRGVDGIRIDVANALVKPAGLPSGAWPLDQEGVHDIYRQWRSILDSYTPPRAAVAEAWVGSHDELARYVRPDELHQAFNFFFLMTPWKAPALRAVVDASLAAMGAVGAPSTWVMSNHDVVRHASRLARGDGGVPGGVYATDNLAEADPALGLRRARAAILLMLALPGSVYLYQGEELGLPEVFDLPADARQDPVFARSGGSQLGRDGCRVPLPWSGLEAPFGFGPAGSRPWLPQPAAWAALTAAAQEADPASMLHLYRAALRLRRALPREESLTWLSDVDSAVLSFRRTGLVCVLNLSDAPADPPTGEPLLLSGPLDDEGRLPPDAAGWWAA